MKFPKDKDRFFARLRRAGSCMVWTGGLTRGGYGHLNLDRGRHGATRGRRAHRVAWELARGPIPRGMFVLHRCDNPPCCNPKHLWLGTHRDNARDMVAKGRDGWKTKRASMLAAARRRKATVCGEAHGNAKLSDAQVAEIREAWTPHRGPAGSRGYITQSELARRYGVSTSLIEKIVRNVLRKKTRAQEKTHAS